MKTMNPLGLSLKSCASWCKRKCSEISSDTILYSGGLYSTMGIVEKTELFLKPIISNPTREAPVKLARPFMGIGSAFLPMFRNKKLERIPERAMDILERLGYNFCCLDEEPYSGALLYDLGFSRELRQYGKRLSEFFKERGVKKIIVMDPHTYELFTEIYPKIIDKFDFEILNLVKILANEIKKGSIKLQSKRSMKVVYHDPCHYSKSSSDKIVNEPREIISAIENVVLEEPENKEALSLCCGGPVEFVFLKLSEEIAKIRYKELTATGADTIITACPICAINFRRVADGNTRVIDLVDLIYESIVGG